MGSVIGAKCKACGFSSSTVVIGGDRQSYLEHAGWPIHCNDCHALRSTNIQREPLVCLTCGSENIGLFGGRETRAQRGLNRRGPYPVATWGDYALPGAPQECPECGEIALVFGEGGRTIMFD